jgi:hypothetical protein
MTMFGRRGASSAVAMAGAALIPIASVRPMINKFTKTAVRDLVLSFMFVSLLLVLCRFALLNLSFPWKRESSLFR